MNSVGLIGRITSDVELKVTEDQTLVCSFFLAVPKNKDAADFPKCVAFNKIADRITKYCGKGSQIGISGKIRTRTWQSKDGRKNYETYIELDNVDFCGSKKESPSAESSGEGLTEISADEDLPF